MTKADLRKLEWVPVEDWSAVTSTSIGVTKSFFGELKEVSCIGFNDVKAFLDDVIKGVARKVNMPYEEVYEVVWKENASAKHYITEVFSKYLCRHIECNEMQIIRKTFLIPKVECTAQNVAEMYRLLSAEEKRKFKILIGE